MNEDHPLSTEDLARASADVRGRQEEAVVNRDAVAEPPTAAQPRPQTTDAIASAARDTGRMEKGAAQASQRDGRASLFAEKDATDLRTRWSDVQAGFVDEPRRAVEQADSLVAEVMKRLAEGFANERASLEHQWDRGDNVTTEDLRVALQRYRSFFDRLLSV
jgi:hypothetical protein